jgi:tRNA pseudouridine38-40 synthase
MRRIRVTLAYDGTEYHGWQVQPGLPTIQSELERVASEIEGSPVAVQGSGRTDAGVHALGQVAAFDLANPIPVDNLRRAINRLLPRDIRILTVEDAPPDFHPRFQARAKTYEYRIFRAEICPPFERLYVCHHPYPLDPRPMEECAALLVGDHDFTAFAASDEKDELGKSKVRTIFDAKWHFSDDLWCFRVRGSGFLKHQVRMIAGTLLEAGKGNLTCEDFLARLQPGYPGKAGPALAACGLFLISVEY